MRLGFFFREATRSLRRNAAPSFAALATVLVTMLMLGIFIPIVQATTGAANQVQRRVLVDVFLKPKADAKDRARVRALIDRTPHVGRVRFISKQEAFAQQRREHPALYQLLGENPLPDAFRITPDPPSAALELEDALRGAEGAAGGRVSDPAIAAIKDRKGDTRKLLTVTKYVKLITGFLAVLLVTASLLLIANTIRLSLFARRREVEVMKLVGATDWFVRWPFMLEGLLVGALGSALAIVVLAVGKITIIDRLSDKVSPIIAAPKTISFSILVLVILGAGAAVSAGGSALSLRRFLRV